MKQSRTMSLIESLTNVAIGFGLQVCLQKVFLFGVGVEISWRQNLLVGLGMTVASVARSFSVRRVFESIRTKSQGRSHAGS